MAQKQRIRINVGGKAYKDREGNVWQADKEYARDSWGCLNLPQTDILQTSDPIANTEDMELFRTLRMGEEILYRFDVPDGEYRVRLLLAEIYWETSSAEPQDVYIQDKRVLKNFNIFDDAGHDRAFEKTCKTKASRGCLEIKFIGRSLPMHSGARVCAIEIQSV